MKRTMIFALMGLLAMGAMAQTRSLAYVDIPSAQARVDSLTEEIATLEQEITTLQQEVTDLRNSIAQNRNQINEIEPILINVQFQSRELYDVMSEITDATMRENAKSNIDRTKELEGRLESKVRDLERSNATSERTIENNLKKIDRNEATIAKNNDEITILNASIEKTRIQQNRLAKIMEDIESSLANAETAIGN
jgi:chromosome segregation ATPase